MRAKYPAVIKSFSPVFSLCVTNNQGWAFAKIFADVNTNEDETGPNHVRVAYRMTTYYYLLLCCSVFYGTFALVLVPGLVSLLRTHAQLMLSSMLKCNPNFLRLVCPCVCHEQTQYVWWKNQTKMMQKSDKALEHTVSYIVWRFGTHWYLKCSTFEARGSIPQWCALPRDFSHQGSMQERSLCLSVTGVNPLSTGQSKISRWPIKFRQRQCAHFSTDFYKLDHVDGKVFSLSKRG